MPRSQQGCDASPQRLQAAIFLSRRRATTIGIEEITAERKGMTCMACGDADQLCCAGGVCTAGVCKEGRCVEETTGKWGHPCDKNGSCAIGLTCNRSPASGGGGSGICQNSVSGPPGYGASCVDSGYCRSQGSGLSCVADLVTPVPSGGDTHFTRCACPSAGFDCGVDASNHKLVCTADSKQQDWEPLKAP
jgi:hypothetical protein